MLTAAVVPSTTVAARIRNTMARMVNRRSFLLASGTAAGVLALSRSPDAQTSGEPIIDIHQHVGYSGRPNEVLLSHQRAMGITTTILLPAGRAARRPSTHDGVANGLQAEALGNDACYAFAQAHPKAFLFGANDVPDLDGATG